MTESYPPEMPEDSNAYQSGSRYDSRTVWWTVGIVVLIIAVGTWLVPFIGLAVPVVLLVSLFFLAAKNQSVRYRSVLAGLLIGLGVGLLITAGLCTAIFSGNLPSPLFPSP
jgi:hypothetical protein